MTTSDREPADLNTILLSPPRSGAPSSEENFTGVSYVAISSRLAGVIIATAGIQGSKVLRSVKQHVILKYTRACLGKVHHLMSLYIS